MVSVIKHLSSQVPIVKSDGTPTPYFARLLEEISDAKIAASVIDAMGGDPGADMVVVWDDATNDLVFLSLSDMLDWIDDTHGAILYRDSAAWAALAPGTAGQILQTNGSGADPSWVDPPESGGVVALSFFNDILVGATLNINSTTYIPIPTQSIHYDVSTMPFNDYRLIWRGQANAAGQTCQFKVQIGGSGLAAGDDISFTNGANTTQDSGWKAITLSASNLQSLNVYMKGSNSTVDFTYVTPLYLYFR